MSEEISYAALRTIYHGVPEQFLNSAIETLAQHNAAEIPNPEALLPGDIVLSSEKEGYENSPIYLKQLADGHPPDIARWTHAMLFVGHLHIAESTTGHENLEVKRPERSGTRFMPITEYSADHDLLVCRPEGLGFPYSNRLEAVNYAMLDVIIRPREYDYNSVAGEALPALKVLSPGDPNLEVVCTHFVVECVGAGGGILLSELDQILNGELFVYPAALANHPRLTTTPVMTYKVVGRPEDLGTKTSAKPNKFKF